MIEKMTKYSFVLLDAGKEDFLSSLQELGLVDITRSSKPVDERSATLLDSMEARKKRLDEIKAGSDATLKALNDKLSALRKEEEQIRVWGSWDRSAIAATGLSLHFYKVSSKKFDASWEAEYAIFKVDDDGKYCYFVIAGDNALFPLKEIPGPAKNLSELEEEIKAQEAEIKAYAEGLEAAKADIPDLQKEISVLQGDFSRALASAAAEGAAENLLAVFEGFAPVGHDEELEKKFDEMDVVWFKDAAVLEDNPPIEFKN
ncbi:MAG: hypothetical protein K6F21_02940, partial [Bacteroidales bacterium]|nr:hypothetical protein [Bacteroidales bacterium]